MNKITQYTYKILLCWGETVKPAIRISACYSNREAGSPSGPGIPGPAKVKLEIPARGAWPGPSCPQHPVPAGPGDPPAERPPVPTWRPIAGDHWQLFGPRPGAAAAEAASD